MTLQGTTHIFKLSLSDKSADAPPHLVAACIKASEVKDFRPVRLNAIGRARGTNILNGAIPGSAAASAAVNLYSGSQGEKQPTSTSRICCVDSRIDLYPSCRSVGYNMVLNSH